MKPLNNSFFERDSAKVARELLGKIVVRKLDVDEIDKTILNSMISDKKKCLNSKNICLKSKIVETEAYYGRKDPASRFLKTPNMAKVMLESPGTIFTYMVHNNWMFNIVTEKKGKAGAVLLRALEPLNFFERMKGPGLLSRALRIDKRHNNTSINSGDLTIAEGNNEPLTVNSSHRIGVSEDMKRKLRFFIKGNKFVSKRYLR